MFLFRLIWSRFTLVILLFAGLATIIAFYGITPYNAWQEQRETIADIDSRLEAVRQENQALREEVERLSTHEEVELVARRDHKFIYPGEIPYVILPSEQ